MKRFKLNNLLDQGLLFIKTSNNNSGQFNRVLCLAVLIGYLISWSSVAYDALVSKPGTVLPPRFHIWTVFSAPLVENHLLIVLFNVLFILTLGKAVTPLWGDVESIIYFAVVNLSTIAVCSFVYLVLYILRGDLHYLYYVRLHGLTSYVVALSVAVKQVMPEQVVVKLPNEKKIRNRNIPSILVLASVVLWLTRLLPSEFMLMAFSGWIAGFVYLRYFQKHSGAFAAVPGGQSVGERGDLSDAFSFATFFPKAFQPAVNVISSACFDLLVKAKVCRKPIRRYVMGVPLDGVVAGSDGQYASGLPSSANRIGGGLSISVGSAGAPLSQPTHDEERRRNIAVKALSERLPTAATTLPPTAMTNHMPATSPVPTAQYTQNLPTAFSPLYGAGPAPIAGNQFVSSNTSAYYNPALYTQTPRNPPPARSAGDAIPLAQSSTSDIPTAMTKFLSPATTTAMMPNAHQQSPLDLPPGTQPMTSSSGTIPANMSSASFNSLSPRSVRAAPPPANNRYDPEGAKEFSAGRSTTESSSPASSIS